MTDLLREIINHPLVHLPDYLAEKVRQEIRDRGSKPDRAETAKTGSVEDESPGAIGNRPTSRGHSQ